jgi:hypothetical protein
MQAPLPSFPVRGRHHIDEQMLELLRTFECRGADVARSQPLRDGGFEDAKIRLKQASVVLLGSLGL